MEATRGEAKRTRKIKVKQDCTEEEWDEELKSNSPLFSVVFQEFVSCPTVPK